MGFNIQATIGADGSGFFREMGKVEASARAHEAKAARWQSEARDATTERIALEQRLLLLKRGEANLAGRADAAKVDPQAVRRTEQAQSRAEAMLAKEVEAQKKLRDEVTRTAALKVSAEAKVLEARERVRKAEAYTGAGAGGLLAAAKERSRQAREELVAVNAEARAARQAANKDAGERAARLAQLERRAARLGEAAATAKVGSEQYDRLTAALKRVQQQASSTTDQISRLHRTSATAGAAAAQAMQDAKAIRSGKLKAGVSELGGGLLSGFGGGALGAAGAGIAVAALTHKTIEYGGRLYDLSARLGVSTDALQELDYAMTLNGATLEDATVAMQKLGIARQEALEKGGEKMEAFKALGISVEQLKTARLEDLFKAVGRSVRDTADVQTVLGDAIEVMGKGSGNVLAAMRSDLDAAGEDARRLGLIIEADVIAKLDELGDRAATTGKRFVAGFAPVLTFVDYLFNSFMDLGALVGEVFGGLPARLFGALSAGASLKDAAMLAFRETQREINQIIDRHTERSRDRAPAPRGDAALGFAGDGTEAAGLRGAARAVELRERIAKMDRDALPLAERRAAIEREILKKRVELASLEASEDTGEGGTGEVRALQLQLEQRELQKQLDGLKEEKSEKAGRAFESQQNTDSLSKKGLFIGSGPAGVTVAPLTGQQATREFTRMVQTMERLIAVSESGHNRVASAVTRTL